MLVGDRLKDLRGSKKLSQGDIEKRSGLLRCYISRVENGHTVPSVETLERLAIALEMPMYRLFYDGEIPPKAIIMRHRREVSWGETGKDAGYWRKLRALLHRMEPRHRSMLLQLVKKLATKK